MTQAPTSSAPSAGTGWDRLLTALAPAVWGSTYIVTSELLPPGYPLMAGLLRALPAGLILLVVVRQLPPRIWLLRLFVLGALNFSIFWTLLFVAAYRLPGGVAATLGAIQPLMVIALARITLGSPIPIFGVIAAFAGIAGVGFLILEPGAGLDWVGIIAALGGALSMAFGTVFSRKWQPPVSALTFTAWQLTAGGLLLLPVALIGEPNFPLPSAANLLGYAWLGLVGAALTYFLWFRGLARLGPAAVTNLGFLSPLSAVVLGWALLGQALSPAQLFGAVLVLGAVWLGQRQVRTGTPVLKPLTPAGRS